MSHNETSALLSIVETIHWIALAVMGSVYAVRLWWLFRFRRARERQAPGDLQRTNASKGAVYSLANIGMPWAMESTRRGFFFYLTFVVFHLGVTAGIGLAFVSAIHRPLLESPAVAKAVGGMLTAAFLVGLFRIGRRIIDPVMRLISTPDDYFSLVLLTIWFLLGVLAQAHIVGELQSELYLVAFLIVTSFFLIYVPFSKISHYLYYPFTRFWLGYSLGHRGSLPYKRG